LYFDTLEKAGAAVEHILKFDPIAVEFMEKNFLDIVRREKAVSAEYLPQQAEAVLLVEFALDSPEKNRAALRSMAARVADELKLSFTWREAYDTRQQELLWKLRKAVQPILYKLPPPKQITGFIEDGVIPPARLAEYIRGLWAIFKKHGVEAATFGHAGDANLHVRPLLDLRTQQDIDKMVAMADEANDLVLRMGGTLSGEHGDGRVRSPYLRRQFGPVYDLMRQVKRIWDPQGLLAPENVITDRTQMSTDDLRLGAGYRLVETGSDYDRPAMRLEAEKCHGCGTCLAYCPVYLASGEPLAAPRAKCNLLQAVISGELDFHKLGLDPRFKAVADLCYNCKTCRVECPSNVNAAALMLVEKAHWARHKGLPLADRLFSRARLVAKLGSLTAPLSNALARWPLVQKLGRAAAGIAARPMPRFSRDTLEGYAPSATPKREGGVATRPGRVATDEPAPTAAHGDPCGVAMPPPRSSAHKVALFAGCFYIFNDAAAGRALVDVLRALGCEVVLPEQRCCGLPAYTSGDRLAALKDAEFNLAVLGPLVDAGYDIVSGCPSCTLSLREDYPDLLNVEESRQVSSAVYDAHEYVARLLAEKPAQASSPIPVGRLLAAAEIIESADAKHPPYRLAYHAPCHLRALGLGAAPKELLERAGLKFHLVNTTCCGMGGTFGLKQKNLELSNKIAADFFKRLRDAHIDAVVTPCGMCKTQIEGQTGLRVYHPMELLANLLKEEMVKA
jgi:Fe-S oxidoreductase